MQLWVQKYKDLAPGVSINYQSVGSGQGKKDFVGPEIKGKKLGVIGLAGRASSQAWDLRAQAKPAPYGALGVRMKTLKNGDVAARVILRFDEIFESLRLVRTVIERIAPGEIAAALSALPAGTMGLGWAEGWRGESVVALESDADGRIRSCHAHDPSWQNWPALAFAVFNNIVPDFPLINKSFNLSYSGCDL